MLLLTAKLLIPYHFQKLHPSIFRLTWKKNFGIFGIVRLPLGGYKGSWGFFRGLIVVTLVSWTNFVYRLETRRTLPSGWNWALCALCNGDTYHQHKISFSALWDSPRGFKNYTIGCISVSTWIKCIRVEAVRALPEELLGENVSSD